MSPVAHHQHVAHLVFGSCALNLSSCKYTNHEQMCDSKLVKSKSSGGNQRHNGHVAFAVLERPESCVIFRLSCFGKHYTIYKITLEKGALRNSTPLYVNKQFIILSPGCPIAHCIALRICCLQFLLAASRFDFTRECKCIQ